MKNIAVVFTLLAIALPSLAQEVVITTGGRGGSYFATGEKLAEVLIEYEYEASAVKSNGSVENIERVVSGEAALGFTQIDALAWWLTRNPETESKIKVLGNLFSECVYVAVNNRGPVDDEKDLKSSKANVAVQKRGSGSAVSWEYIRELEPDFAKSATYYQGGLQLLNEIANNSDSEINAFLWVSNPDNLDQRYLKTVMENERLELLDIEDWDLNDKHPTLGRPIYRFEKPEIAKGLIFDKEIETICMDAIAIGSATADSDVIDDVVDILTLNRARLFDD